MLALQAVYSPATPIAHSKSVKSAQKGRHRVTISDLFLREAVLRDRQNERELPSDWCHRTSPQLALRKQSPSAGDYTVLAARDDLSLHRSIRLRHVPGQVNASLESACSIVTSPGRRQARLRPSWSAPRRRCPSRPCEFHVTRSPECLAPAIIWMQEKSGVWVLLLWAFCIADRSETHNTFRATQPGVLIQLWRCHVHHRIKNWQTARLRQAQLGQDQTSWCTRWWIKAPYREHLSAVTCPRLHKVKDLLNAQSCSLKWNSPAWPFFFGLLVVFRSLSWPSCGKFSWQWHSVW